MPLAPALRTTTKPAASAPAPRRFSRVSVFSRGARAKVAAQKHCPYRWTPTP